MALLTEPVPNPRMQRLGWGIALLALVSLALSAVALSRSGSATTAASTRNDVAKAFRLQTIVKQGVIRVGYGGYPPYTISDPKETDPNKRVKGFSVDLVAEIAARSTPPLRVEWVKLNWDTLKADMLSDKFDFIADPVFETVPRALDFGFSEPYSYFGIAVAVVRKEDNRFKSFKDLDQPGITIALAQAWTSSEFARKNLSKPTFKDITVTGDAFNQLDEVLLGRADVALNDVPTVAQYVSAHRDKV